MAAGYILPVGGPSDPLQFLEDGVLSGNYLYVINRGGNDNFSVVDVSNRAVPVVVATLLDGEGGGVNISDPSAICVSGNRAYVVSMGSKALEIINITDPVHPTHLGTLVDVDGEMPTDPGATGPYLSIPSGIVVSGNYAFISARFGLEVVDVSNPASPTHVTNLYEVPSNDAPSFVEYLEMLQAIDISGNYAYVARNVGPSARFTVIDISTPTAPTKVGTVEHNNLGPLLLNTQDIVVSGNHAYVVVDNDALEIIDITTPSTPAHLSFIKHSNVLGIKMDGPRAVSIAGGYAYVVSWNSSSLEVIDISNPASPQHVAALVNSGTGDPPYLSSPNSIAVSGNYGYIGGSGVQLISIFTPGPPVIDKGVVTTLPSGEPEIDQSTSIRFRWLPVAGLTYTIEVSADDFVTKLPGYDGVTVTGTAAQGSQQGWLQSHITGLTPNTTYKFRMKAVNGNGPSDPSNIVTVTTALPAPVANAATDVEFSSFKINWQPVPGATNYLLYLYDQGSLGFPNGHFTAYPMGNVTTFELSGGSAGLFPAFSYIYRVTALNANGQSPKSNQINLTTKPYYTVFKPATLVTQTSFVANWNPDPNSLAVLTNYFLDVATDEAFTQMVPGYNNLSVPLATAPSKLVDTGISPGTTYYYRVRQANATGSSPDSPDEISVTTVPAAPTLNAGTAITETGFTASWNAVTGVTGYRIDVATNEGFTGFVSGHNDKALPATPTTLVIPGLSPGITYYYRVRAYNGGGISSSQGVTEVVTLPAAPPTVTTTDVGQTGFKANWTAILGASHYFIDVSTDALFTAYVTGFNSLQVTGLSQVVTGLSANTTYYYRVRAANASGSSANSIAVTVLTGPTAPVAIAATNVGQTSFTANWNAVVNATGYKVDVSGNELFSGFVPGFQDATASGTSLNITGLAAGTTYHYRVRATNGSGASNSSNVISQGTIATFLPILLPTGGKVTDYRVISIPDGATASTSLASESFETSWRVMHFDGSNNVDVRDVTKLVPGLGYWVNSKLDQAPTITVGGTFTANTKTVTLHPGWNQIGDPFAFSISWLDVLAKNTNPTGVGDFYTYTGKFDKADGLLVYGGGFVNNTNTSNVTLTIPPNVARFNGKVRAGKYDIEGRDISADEWFLPLTLKAGDVVSDLGGIGMHSDAKISIDPFDAIALPRFFEYADLSSTHPEFFQPRFMRDVAPAADTYTWTFFATTNSENREAELVWDNTTWKGLAQIYLYDEEEGVLLDMTKSNRYNFNLKSSKALRFFYGRHGVVSPEVTGFGQPFPNPSSAEISFPFLAGHDDEVQVRLFDMTGRPVQTLSSENRASGYKEAIWNATNQQGERLPAGMYVYRFASKAGRTSIGKVVLR